MTQLTYTIAHVRVGAENYWEEVGGFLSSDLEALLLKEYHPFLFELAQLYSRENYVQGSCPQYETKIQIKYKEKQREKLWLKQNTSHPLSPFAKELGAMIFGGFEDEKDFYVVMPTKNSFKFGDILYRSVNEEYEDFSPVFEKYNRKDFIFCEECYFDIKDDLNHEQYTAKGNIFQEYARTGVLENELYKQFFE